MDAGKESIAFQNMKDFWSKRGKSLVADFKAHENESPSDYITRGSYSGTRAEAQIAKELEDCKYLILTANSVESQTLKRLLYEESKNCSIFNYWMLKEALTQASESSGSEGISLPAGSPDRGEREPQMTFSKTHSPRLLEINFEAEVQYYFVTLGAEASVGKTIRKPIKIAYICPSGTSSFSGNGSHKAIVHALRRYSNNHIAYPFVASLGVAFGLCPSCSDEPKEDCQLLGDVLISKNIIAYDSKYKVTEDPNAQGYTISFTECENYNLEQGASRAFSGIINRRGCTPFKPPENMEPEMRQLEERLNMSGLRCHMGPLYSGGAVVSSSRFKESLLNSTLVGGSQRTKELEPIGGEMEGVGIWYACLLEDDQFPCIIIKGICDWGEEKNGWVQLLEQHDRPYLLEKIKEELPLALKKQFDYNKRETAHSLLEEFMDGGVLPEADSMTAMCQKAVDLGLGDEISKIEEKYTRAYEAAKRAVNDRIKNAIQAYATEQAFKVFCYMIYNDPQLILMPARTPLESTQEIRLKTAEDNLSRMKRELTAETGKVAELVTLLTKTQAEKDVAQDEKEVIQTNFMKLTNKYESALNTIDQLQKAVEQYEQYRQLFDHLKDEKGRGMDS